MATKKTNPTQTKEENMDAVKALCETIMTGYAKVAARDARIEAAKSRLGEDRYLDLVVATMRSETKRMIFAPETREQVEVAGNFAAQVLVTEVVANIVKAVLEAN